MQQDKQKSEASQSMLSVLGQPLSWGGQPASPEPVRRISKDIARFVSVFAAGMIVGVFVTWAFSGNRTTVAGSNQPSNATQAAALAIGTEPAQSFSVASPQPAGKRVAIAKVIVQEPTWVVIYEMSGKTIGRALGASLFSASKSSGEVILLRATTPGKTYAVGQALDNGNGTFSVSADKPVMAEGGRLLLTFTAK
jgi:hypothetical protein